MYQFSSHLPLILLSPTPLRCSPCGLSICILTHTHSFPHTLPPVGSSVCVCCHNTQGLIISAPTFSPPLIIFASALLHLSSSTLTLSINALLCPCVLCSVSFFYLKFLVKKMLFGLSLRPLIVFSSLRVSLLSYLTGVICIRLECGHVTLLPESELLSTLHASPLHHISLVLYKAQLYPPCLC